MRRSFDFNRLPRVLAVSSGCAVSVCLTLPPRCDLALKCSPSPDNCSLPLHFTTASMSLGDDSSALDRPFKLVSDGSAEEAAATGGGGGGESSVYEQFAPPPLAIASDRGALCRWCPCTHIQQQLGLQALDNHDALRVWARFASIVIMVSGERQQVARRGGAVLLAGCDA